MAGGLARTMYCAQQSGPDEDPHRRSPVAKVLCDTTAGGLARTKYCVQQIGLDEEPHQRSPVTKASCDTTAGGLTRTTYCVEQSRPDEEKSYLRRNVEHLRLSKRQLEAQVSSLGIRVRSLEE